VPHTVTEETGLFAELRAEGSLTEAVDKLCDEHDDVHGVLGTVDRGAPDWPVILAALDRLHRHIDNEEHGLFPACVFALSIEAWDRVTPDQTGTTTHQHHHDHDEHDQGHGSPRGDHSHRHAA
jgi:hemerythrin-like domain-containing protein